MRDVISDEPSAMRDVISDDPSGISHQRWQSAQGTQRRTSSYARIKASVEMAAASATCAAFGAVLGFPNGVFRSKIISVMAAAKANGSLSRP